MNILSAIARVRWTRAVSGGLAIAAAALGAPVNAEDFALSVSPPRFELATKPGETVRSNFVGIERADIIQAEMKGSEASVTIRIVSKLISATVDTAGKVIDGDLEEVSEVNDVWTYARDTRSRDPNWRLIATEADQ